MLITRRIVERIEEQLIDRLLQGQDMSLRQTLRRRPVRHQPDRQCLLAIITDFVLEQRTPQRQQRMQWPTDRAGAKDALQISKEFPDVTWDKELVDAATARMVNRPASLDTIVATNLHADILSDLAAALAGSLGIAPTANLDPERRYPSMFEPIHGSAFDIMGRGLANPIGTFWSCVMLLEHLGETAAAAALMGAIETVTANRALHTRDLGGSAMTAEVTQAVCSLLSGK